MTTQGSGSRGVNVTERSTDFHHHVSQKPVHDRAFFEQRQREAALKGGASVPVISQSSRPANSSGSGACTSSLASSALLKLSDHEVQRRINAMAATEQASPQELETSPALCDEDKQPDPSPERTSPESKKSKARPRGARLKGRRRGPPVFAEPPRRFLSIETRVKIMQHARKKELETKSKGLRDGSISQIGLRLLEVLMFRFHSKTGQTFPGYAALRKATGLSQGGVKSAIERLEACGYLTVTNRIKRIAITIQSAVTGQKVQTNRVVQDSNAYEMHFPDASVKIEPKPGIERRFPPRRNPQNNRQIGLFQPVQALAVHQSLRRSE